MPRTRPLALLPPALTAALALAVGCVLAVVLLRPEPVPVPSPPDRVTSGGAASGDAPAAAPADHPARRVLRQWDAARAAAYAEGSPASLRRLYVDGAGAADLRVLRAYLRRGLRVEQMSVQVLGFEVLAPRARAGVWRVRVTERLSHAVAVGAGVRRALPRGEATTRVVVLVRAEGEWRVARVRPG